MSGRCFGGGERRSRRGHRRARKKFGFDAELDPEICEDLAEHVWSATLQRASSFMNSVRRRLEAATRTERGGARSGGTYRPGAVFNPRILIAILNIYRVHYNFFEMRPYESYLKPKDERENSEPRRPRGLRYPGTDEIIPSIKKPRRVTVQRTPAMRHYMDAFIVREEAVKERPKAPAAAEEAFVEAERATEAPIPSSEPQKAPTAKTRKVIYPPDIHRVLYRPWLYMGTPVGKKLDRRTGGAAKQTVGIRKAFWSAPPTSATSEGTTKMTGSRAYRLPG